jgi:glyoxylase-like metal-dependent hydrolase (beta-lactamase superfamily II)
LRVLSVHRDAVVVTSRLWQINAIALRDGEEAMLIDSPYFPDELEALPALLAGSGFEPDALLATHGDWDHVLARMAFPSLSLGVAESTMLRFRARPGEAQRQLREADDELYVERPGPLGLGQVQALPVPGKLELGERELELHPAEGHTPDGMAIFDAGAKVLCAGDYLSNVEIPTLNDDGSLEDYRQTLARLGPLVERAESVVPGHGSPQPRDAALRLLDEDLSYLDGLERDGTDAALPEGRDTPQQRKVHAENARELLRR